MMRHSLVFILLLSVFVSIHRVWTLLDTTNHNHLQCSLAASVIDSFQHASEKQRSSWLFSRQQYSPPHQRQDPSVHHSKWITCLFQLQQFDPDAVVAILPGEDGQPGVAGIDDNANGVSDDRSELGATHSDDRCETMSSREARQTSPRPLVLQRGAFVPVDSANAVLKDAEQRIEVLGEWKGKAFSFLLTNQTFFSNEEIP